jgi:hypothetical protein
MAVNLQAYLSLKAKGFQQGLKKAEGGVDKFQKKFGKLKGLVGAGLALGGISAAIKGFASAADEIDNLASKMGISVEKTQLLKIAAENVGMDISVVADAYKTLVIRSQEAAAGNEQLIGWFDQLGISMEMLKSQDIDKMFDQLTVALTHSKNSTAAIGVGMKLLGEPINNLSKILIEYQKTQESVLSVKTIGQLDKLEERWGKLFRFIKVQSGTLFGAFIDKFKVLDPAAWLEGLQNNFPKAMDSISKSMEGFPWFGVQRMGQDKSPTDEPNRPSPLARMNLAVDNLLNKINRKTLNSSMPELTGENRYQWAGGSNEQIRSQESAYQEWYKNKYGSKDVAGAGSVDASLENAKKEEDRKKAAKKAADDLAKAEKEAAAEKLKFEEQVEKNNYNKLTDQEKLNSLLAEQTKLIQKANQHLQSNELKDMYTALTQGAGLQQTIDGLRNASQTSTALGGFNIPKSSMQAAGARMGGLDKRIADIAKRQLDVQVQIRDAINKPQGIEKKGIYG